jgi:hypothetical protein
MIGACILQKLEDLSMKTMRSIGAFLRSAWQFVFCFRKVFLAIPVIVTAIVLACRNASVLPERVGLFLSTEGTFSLLVSRQQAVFGPLLVTGLSLIFMAASRKVFYPWLISVITLVLPFLIQLLNQFGF